MNEQELLLKALAQKCGIDLIGIVDLSSLEGFNDFFSGIKEGEIAFWKGSAASKANMNAEWKKAKGIISFAVSCGNSKKMPPDMAERGRIARCALGKDYHNILKERAKALMELFCVDYPCEYRVYVDTGRLSDRALAYCAGIGFYGKNNFIINESLGSFIFLGHILCDIALESSAFVSKDMCGECELCIKACPKKVCGKRVFDYKNCISYITQTDNEGDTFGWLYGCDICQNACPFNKRENLKYAQNDPFESTLANEYPKLSEIIKAGKEKFNERFACSSMLWAGYEKILKNAKSIMNQREK